MTFLELCQDMMREAGISGEIISVDRQKGEALRVVNWIVKAYNRIQTDRTDWTFLRADVAFSTIASNTYMAAAAGVADFGEWRFVSRWRCFSTAAGYADEQPLSFMPYDAFRDQYLYASNRLATGRPLVITEKPDQSLVLWPTPDTPYTIVGEQFRAPHRLVANDDKPIFPAKFHDAIVHRAMMFYGEFEGDATVFAAAQSEYNRLLSKMEDLYGPEWVESEAMA